MKDELLFRLTVREDLPAIVHLLADDNLGRQREQDEDTLPPSYYAAFEDIDQDSNHQLLVKPGRLP